MILRRLILAAQVQQALLEKCGDRVIVPLDYARPQERQVICQDTAAP